MLVPAITRKDDLLKKFAEIMYSEDYFYYSGYQYCHELPEIRPADNNFQWAFVDEYGVVVGYLAYHIDSQTDSVSRFGLISFDKGNMSFVSAVLSHLRKLVATHRRVEWRCIGGNPVMNIYTKFCNEYGGHEVCLHDVCKGPDGTFRDEHIYEIVRREDS